MDRRSRCAPSTSLHVITIAAWPCIVWFVARISGGYTVANCFTIKHRLRHLIKEDWRGNTMPVLIPLEARRRLLESVLREHEHV